MYVSTLTDGHELWLLNKKMRSWIQAAKKALCQRKLLEKPLLLPDEENQQIMVQATD